MSTRDVPTGIYRHWKGALYQVLGLAHDANSDKLYSSTSWLKYPDGRVCVVYIGLELDNAHMGPRLAVRDVDDFFASVDGVTGALTYARMAGAVPRFEYLGSMLTPDMIVTDDSGTSDSNVPM